MDYHSPIFILGNPRSGTTLLRLMLNSHGKVVIPPEAGFLQWLSEKYKDWSELKSNDIELIDRWLHDLSNTKKIETWQLDYRVLKKYILTERPKTYSELAALVYASYGNGLETRWGDKNNYYIDHIPLLMELYPSAQFIHLVRDGRDVACSYKAIEKQSAGKMYAPKLPQEINAIAKEWQRNNQKIESFFNSDDKKADKYFLVKYESILSETKRTLQSICDFLKIPFDSEMQNYYNLRSKNKQEPEALISWKMKTREKPDANNIGKYKQLLTSDEITLFNLEASESLKFFGYES